MDREYFKSLKRKKLLSNVQQNVEKLLQSSPEENYTRNQDDLQTFQSEFTRYMEGEPLNWDSVEPFPSACLTLYELLSMPSEDPKKLLNKLVIIKLSGGLGSRMKCDLPKALLEVHGGFTFLDLTIQQVESLNIKHDVSIPLIFMNSFNTNEKMQDALNDYDNLRTKIYTFDQNKYPSIYWNKSGLLPSSYNDADIGPWYPPGHGNFYHAITRSPLLQKFLAEGREFVFVSNIDNLGAKVDLKILDFLVNSDKKPDFIMEVTDRTSNDAKGGTLIHYDGKLRLLEQSEIPADLVDMFKTPEFFTTYNTNNLWMKLETIRELAEDSLPLPIFGSKKTLRKDGELVDVLQLETAIGSGIHYFPSAQSVLVPRSRFVPVKTSSDLFVQRSNAYVVENDELIKNHRRTCDSPPVVKLDDHYFGSYKDLDRLIEIPDCLDLRQLLISGDVTFGKNVVLVGDVKIIASSGERIDVPRGSILQNCILMGSLGKIDL